MLHRVLLSRFQLHRRQASFSTAASSSLSLRDADNGGANKTRCTMADHAGKEEKHNVFDLDYGQMEKLLKSQNYPRYRAEQLWRALYDERLFNFHDIQAFPKRMRSQLERVFTTNIGRIDDEQISTDGTCKWLLELPHGLKVETVYIPEGRRGTLCISSQVGCALACSFCHTGTQKFQRNLKHADIVGQVLLAGDRLRELDSRSKITNIVFMGQGEPLLNWRNTFRASNTLCDPRGLGYGKSRITISTVGVAPKIKEVGTETGVGLAVSLHSAIDETRSRIMAINRSYPLKELHRTCTEYLEAVQESGKSRARDNRITFEYTLLDGVNDDRTSLDALKKWCNSLGRVHAHVNLIPYNEWPGSPWTPSSDDKVEEFQRKLKEANIMSTIRWPRGRDILAACGQLNSSQSDVAI
eukprot:gb/GECG01006059.1/.p1 GENE.gb/GECG01006059.1/~~gb/GECG01006059.1/.p1  ORF type:complete len:412 (+),score=48.16 gb/GECG01006059.1/:1-1236(+)